MTLLLALAILAAQPRHTVEAVGAWTTNGPDGGGVTTLATSDLDPATVYAGAGTLFKSEDGGIRWAKLNGIEDFLNEAVVWVAVAHSYASVVYVREDNSSVHGFSSVLYRSDDAGASWHSVLDVEDSGRLLNVSVDPTDALTLYATPVNSYALKSTNGGQTWDVVLSGVGSVVIDPVTPTTLYAQQTDLLKSLDGGATWASTGLAADPNVEWVAVDPLDPRILYARGAGFARSDDGGASVSPDTTSPGQISALAFGAGTPRKLYAAVFEGTTSALYASPDRGATWSRAGAPPGGLGGFAITPTSGQQDRILAGGGQRGVFLSTDGGGSWTPRSGGLSAAHIPAIAVFPSDGRTAYALGPGLAKTIDGGASWSVDPSAPVASNGDIAVDPTNRDILYASEVTAGVLRSDDGGTTWAPTAPIAHFVTSIALDPLHPTTLYAADGSPLKSADSGAHWTVADVGIPSGITRIAVDPSNDAILYAIGPSLYRSTDAGATWTVALDTLVAAIASDPGHPGRVYAGAAFIWRSDDFGETWSIPVPLPDTEVSSLSCDANGIVYAAAHSTNPYFGGLATPLRSLDGGTTWGAIGGWDGSFRGLPFHDYVLKVDPSSWFLYAGTDRGVWRIPLRPTRSVSRARP